MNPQNNEVEDYKAALEKEWGETILALGLVHVLKHSSRAFPQEAWCLGLLTQSKLILQSGESENWFTLLLKQKRRGQEQEHPVLEIPRASIQSLTRVNKKGFLERWFPRPAVFILRWVLQEESHDLLVELVPTDQNLFQDLLA